MVRSIGVWLDDEMGVSEIDRWGEKTMKYLNDAYFISAHRSAESRYESAKREILRKELDDGSGIMGIEYKDEVELRENLDYLNKIRDSSQETSQTERMLDLIEDGIVSLPLVSVWTDNPKTIWVFEKYGFIRI